MKKLIYIFLTFIFVSVFVGCKKKIHSQLESLELSIECNPDSVYAVLQTLDEESKYYDKANRMFYGLLRLRCQNILDLQFDSKENIGTLIEYYNSNGTYSQTLLANYLMGRAYMGCGDEPMAVEYFNKCLSLKYSSKDDVDYILLSKVHSQLDEIYGNQNLIQYQINELDAAIDCAMKGGDTLMSLTYEFFKTYPYYKFGQQDSVLSITQKVRNGFSKYGLKEKAAEVLYMAICVLIDQCKYSEAKHYIDIFETQSDLFANDGEIAQGWEIYYRVKGGYYAGIDRLDSAECQYRKLLAHADDINNADAAYNGLLSVYRILGITDSVGKYAALYCQANDTLHAHSVAAEVARLKSIYNYNDYKKKTEEMRLADERIKQRNVILLVFVCLVVLIGFAYLLSYRRKKQDEIMRLIKEYGKIQQTIEDLKGDRKELIRKHKKQLEEIEGSLSQKGVPILDKTRNSTVSPLMKEKFMLVGEMISIKNL